MEAAVDGVLMTPVFPPTPPSSTSSPALVDMSPCWEDVAGGCWSLEPAAAVLDPVLDGLPDVKPDVSELLQASLRTDLPVLNADSTNFLLDVDTVDAMVTGSGAPLAAAPWAPQWTYCAFCAAGGTVQCQGVVQTGPQGYLQGVPQGVPQVSLSQPQAGPPQLYPQQYPYPSQYSDGLGLLYVDQGVDQVSDSRWAPALGPGPGLGLVTPADLSPSSPCVLTAVEPLVNSHAFTQQDY
ncbi:hypothetical protein KUF71_003061 [Frankliniella fusca]|uniref:Uncharacterized protein n=1 Tax=Frankliniella fusca TaxID=407009 RepID=A0AAE1GRD4_9NEOP|nr:hypothetical protein KUF71_003061 [Frankliniella fusca]